MNVREDSKSPHSEYKGQSYYFCSDKCRQEFDRNPSRYLREGQNKEEKRPS